MINIVALSVPPFSSLMLYGIATPHVNHGFGVNVILPATSIVTTHPVTGILCATPGVSVTPLISVILRLCPSTSLSLTNGCNNTLAPTAQV